VVGPRIGGDRWRSGLSAPPTYMPLVGKSGLHEKELFFFYFFFQRGGLGARRDLELGGTWSWEGLGAEKDKICAMSGRGSLVSGRSWISLGGVFGT
jgi:hypothetical protein